LGKSIFEAIAESLATFFLTGLFTNDQNRHIDSLRFFYALHLLQKYSNNYVKISRTLGFCS
jgi:hypothetical protein